MQAAAAPERSFVRLFVHSLLAFLAEQLERIGVPRATACKSKLLHGWRYSQALNPKLASDVFFRCRLRAAAERGDVSGLSRCIRFRV